VNEKQPPSAARIRVTQSRLDSVGVRAEEIVGELHLASRLPLSWVPLSDDDGIQFLRGTENDEQAAQDWAEYSHWVAEQQVSNAQNGKGFLYAERLVRDMKWLRMPTCMHPMSEVWSELKRRYSIMDSCDLKHTTRDQAVCMAGRIIEYNQRMTKSGQTMANLVVDDIYGRFNVTVFPGTLPVVRDCVELNACVLLYGKVQHRAMFRRDKESEGEEAQDEQESTSLSVDFILENANKIGVIYGRR
jgi:DNA polymerase III alpha subunit